MRVAVFSAKRYDREFLEAANTSGHQFIYLEPALDTGTAVLAAGSDAICLFVNDRADAAAIEILAGLGVRLIALRCSGFNNVDLAAARAAGIEVARVPSYSPAAVAEHGFALLLALNRKIHRAYNRVRECNFSLEGLMGFNLQGKTLGVVGLGEIGTATARIGHGFGMAVLGSDPDPSAEAIALGVPMVALPDLLARSDVVTLHCPLTPTTRHMIDDRAIERMKPGAILINTSRGAVLDTRAVIAALKQEKLGGLGIDVYEEEASLFFEDRSDQTLADDLFARLLTFPNVLITGHQGFFTHEAMTRIAEVTIANLDQFAATGRALYSALPYPASEIEA
ncbi:2-hydroxyacid dehydrogenase [Sphingomonas arenae]|uniref:2-hydroxyacid dehydrogenase n=1 Tax=Sphingomonas arenae TaxID=2812555 RepID=UPI00196761EC|nr:2-hydroxyacid dehydrogenase [Sphingomonas arenae]